MSQSAHKPVLNPSPPNGLRVLVVDDEKALADLVASYLTRDGFEVSIAHDGRQAIDVAREVDPDVMVLDLGLPVIDGVEVCPGDPERIAQVLGNLLDNALRHTPAAATASPPITCGTSSNASTGSTPPGIGLTGVPASGWPSPRPWPRPMAGSSPWPAPA